ncbi:hypothetical protein CV014_26465 [Nostoc sp. CMAA1605]|nr:hypothetical protein [Nostoc sp. CMAA1605]
MLFRFAYIGLCLLSIALSFYAKNQLERFLQTNTAITNETSLEDYKNLARIAMYIVLTQMLLLFCAFGSCVFSIFQQGFRGAFSLFLLGFAVAFAGQVGDLEEKSRNLTCANEELENQYKQITHTWRKKALPDF